jgi:hypothetical protein
MLRFVRPAVVACLATIACAAVSGQMRTLPQLLPVDEAVQRPGFFTFRAHLQAAVARRDWTMVLAAVHPDIRNSFGPDDGLPAFRAEWKEGAIDSPLWAELGAVLALGGSFDQAGHFVAPYVFSRWPADLDAFEHIAVVGSRVRVRVAPRLDAEVLTTVNYAIFPRATRSGEQSPGEEDRWIRVALPEGRTGFVAASYARSPVDYRAIFRETAGRWQMVALIAGD